MLCVQQCNVLSTCLAYDLSLVSSPLLMLWQVIEPDFVSDIDIDFVIDPGNPRTLS